MNLIQQLSQTVTRPLLSSESSSLAIPVGDVATENALEQYYAVLLVCLSDSELLSRLSNSDMNGINQVLFSRIWMNQAERDIIVQELAKTHHLDKAILTKVIQMVTPTVYHILETQAEQQRLPLASYLAGQFSEIRRYLPVWIGQVVPVSLLTGQSKRTTVPQTPDSQFTDSQFTDSKVTSSPVTSSQMPVSQTIQYSENEPALFDSPQPDNLHNPQVNNAQINNVNANHNVQKNVQNNLQNSQFDNIHHPSAGTVPVQNSSIQNPPVQNDGFPANDLQANSFPQNHFQNNRIQNNNSNNNYLNNNYSHSNTSNDHHISNYDNSTNNQSTANLIAGSMTSNNFRINSNRNRQKVSQRQNNISALLKIGLPIVALLLMMAGAWVWYSAKQAGQIQKQTPSQINNSNLNTTNNSNSNATSNTSNNSNNNSDPTSSSPSQNGQNTTIKRTQPQTTVEDASESTGNATVIEYNFEENSNPVVDPIANAKTIQSGNSLVFEFEEPVDEAEVAALQELDELVNTTIRTEKVVGEQVQPTPQQPPQPSQQSNQIGSEVLKNPTNSTSKNVGQTEGLDPEAKKLPVFESVNPQPTVDY